MRILYAAMKYDYGRPAQGLSFEHYNFYESLLHMGHDILYFDVGTITQERGRDAANRRLLEVAQSERPDLMFTVLMRDELDPATVQRISDDTDTLTINWFCDDHWRFESFTQHWAPRFNWVVTTAASALPKYAALGYYNVIKSQWGCNSVRYRPLDLPKQYDVTFVGLPHGDRRLVIEKLRKAGIDIRVWGRGWEQGRIDQDQMIRVFNQSRINLNLSNSSVTPNLIGRLVDVATRSIQTSPLPPAARELAARRLAVLRGRVGTTSSGVFEDQIKGRNFEIPGCGGFLLTGHADNLEDFYIPNREVVCFAGVDQLVDKIRHYLKHADEAELIAHTGYQRTIREHTYNHRFSDVFRRAGLGPPAAADSLSGVAKHGTSEDMR
jgi:spore maturation protein CgeB